MCREILNQLGSDAVDRAVTVVGQSFYRRPTELRFADAFGRGVLSSEGAKSGLVELSGQGPLPIGFRGKIIDARMIAFEVAGGALPPLLGIAPEKGISVARLGVIVEHHARDIMQHQGGGAAWDVADHVLGNVFEDGGSGLLFPDYYRHFMSHNGILALARLAGKILGILPDQVVILSENHGGLPQYLPEWVGEILSASELNDLTVINAEQVNLRDHDFKHVTFLENGTNHLHHAWINGDVREEVALTRIHSACSSSEVWNAKNCDCPPELDFALNEIGENGGIFIYLDQEARGNGLSAKVQTWPLNIGHRVDLVTAFNAAGYQEDLRNMQPAAEILKALKVKGVILMTNNVGIKVLDLERRGVEIYGRRPIHIEPQTEYWATDIATKQSLMGHQVDGPIIGMDDPRLKRRYH
ncbi:MAG: hypothetical protein U0946_02890 [Patescibacteria group bacterium]|nr:hypothetical protein [Patescibacteria group bacterium]